MGSGIAGLAGMTEERGIVLRPLLSLGREDLGSAVAEAGLSTIADPTNEDLRIPRNRMRRRVIPALGGASITSRARSLGDAASALNSGLERRLLSLFPELEDCEHVRASVATLRALPPELLSWALALLHRRAGADYPPRASSIAQLRGQLAGGGDVSCDCGGGWRWRGDRAGWLVPWRVPEREVKSTMPFAYTVSAPGGIEIREVGQTFRLSQQPVAAWMWQGAPGRAALALPLTSGETVTVRSRRAGDRLQPLGCEHPRRLKDVFIDRKMPRERRDRLPLLCVGEQVAWVPGVTIHHPFRLADDAIVAWVAELSPIDEAASTAEGTIRA
jgi:tRNA(Ile)-lysidine synthase